ncbi:MAG: RNA methyltransferase [Chlamydiia bacterium]|nr:RNA methyltransferase [Chlamydiia bacterium]
MMITSVQNPKFKQAFRLFKRKERDMHQRFLIEGYRELLRAHEGGWEVETLYYCPDLFLGTNEFLLIKNIQKKGASTFEMCKKVFTRLSYRDRPDGLIGIGKYTFRSLNQLLRKGVSPFLVVTEAIEKPGNLGTIFRSADAAGATGVIVCDKCTDPYNPNVVRASVGTLFTVPLAEAGGSETLDWLQAHKIPLIATTPGADLEYFDTDLTGPIAIAVGTEQLGLTDKWLTRADKKVKIPMSGRADSLNVATATTLLLYEVVRQRR